MLSRAWVTKYQDKVWAIITAFDPGQLMTLTGLAVLRDFPAGDEEFDEFAADFPFIRLDFFSENWKRVISDKPGENKYVIRHVDGTEILIDRLSGQERIRIIDGVHGHEILADGQQILVKHGGSDSKLTLKENGDVQVDATGDVILDAGTLQDGVVTKKSFDPFTRGPHPDGSSNVTASHR